MTVDERTVLAQELASTIAQFWRVGRPHGAFQGIKLSEFMLLVAMTHCTASNSGGIKISDLSTRMQITPAAVTHMINSLEKGEYVERLADSSDRRIVLVRPTGRGEQAIEGMQEQRIEALKELISYLGEQDSQEFIRLISSTLTYFKERGYKNADKFEA
ncbi:MAG: MarR family transcriptional regulator [Desulfitobacteriaceae bacterium]